MTLPISRQCTGTNRRGERCKRAVAPGQDKCSRHGGTVDIHRLVERRLLVMMRSKNANHVVKASAALLRMLKEHPEVADRSARPEWSWLTAEEKIRLRAALAECRAIVEGAKKRMEAGEPKPQPPTEPSPTYLVQPPKPPESPQPKPETSAPDPEQPPPNVVSFEDEPDLKECLERSGDYEAYQSGRLTREQALEMLKAWRQSHRGQVGPSKWHGQPFNQRPFS
jgi:hypothetical protein